MAHDSFRWKQGKLPPNIESHSDAKLNLLAYYIDRYFDTVSVNPVVDRIFITFVDGFSGGGQYLRHGVERPGSPFVLLEAVKKAEQRINLNRTKPLKIDAQYFFVDASESAVLFLKNELRERGYDEDVRSERIKVIRSEFEKVYTKIIDEIVRRQRAGRSIFILDQKGWNGVQFQTIKDILQRLTRSEVILTFAVDWLTSYLNDGNTFTKAMERLGIGKSRLREYMEAKGAEGVEYIIPRFLIEDIQQFTGAPFFTPFFIRSEKAQRDLWIIHLSKIVTARNVMVESHWEIGNSSLHRGPTGLNMLGFDPHWVKQPVLDFGFDDHADLSMRTEILQELPDMIGKSENQRGATPTFSNILHEIANNTPATKNQIADAIKVLHNEKHLDVLNPSGVRKRPGAQVGIGDFIRLTREPKFPGFDFKK